MWKIKGMIAGSQHMLQYQVSFTNNIIHFKCFNLYFLFFLQLLSFQCFYLGWLFSAVNSYVIFRIIMVNTSTYLTKMNILGIQFLHLFTQQLSIENQLCQPFLKELKCKIKQMKLCLMKFIQHFLNQSRELLRVEKYKLENSASQKCQEITNQITTFLYNPDGLTFPLNLPKLQKGLVIRGVHLSFLK